MQQGVIHHRPSHPAARRQLLAGTGSKSASALSSHRFNFFGQFPIGRLRIQIQICMKGIHGVKLISYAPGMDQSEHHHRLAVVAADWCPRLYSWVVTPPLLGVYVFTDRPPRPPPTGVSACTAGLLCRCCWASTSSPTGRLARRRLVFPPARLAYYAAVVGRLRLHRPAASPAADWCFRLHGWPIMPLLLGVYVFTDRPPRPPPTGVSACTAGLLCRRCWAFTSSPTGRLARRRLVFPPARLAYYVAVVGRLRLHRPAASPAADWCFRLHGWPIMSPLLGVYVFTDRPPRPPPTGVSACTAGLLCRCCWASTSSPTGRLARRRLVFPPTRLACYAAVVGRLRLHRPAASSATDWCHRLHGWPVMTPTDAIFFTAGYITVTANRHHLQHKLSTSAADYAFIFITARLQYQFASVADDSCSLHHGNATLSSW
uniref:cysteine dioxygenase n=1 Tax=Oryza sativa subsp. japonica TaxID=39947 RepID=Q6Z580_ORYSJ|nr:HGWP repeat containing protein-like [Oryza sativa Japonica Group]